jgi:hypothetical protein
VADPARPVVGAGESVGRAMGLVVVDDGLGSLMQGWHDRSDAARGQVVAREAPASHAVAPASSCTGARNEAMD